MRFYAVCRIVGAALLSVVACFGLALGAYAQTTTVEFPDPGLDSAVRLAVSHPTGAIPIAKLESLTELNASSRDIVSLAGLEACTSLRRLYLNDNNLQDISELANLSELTTLYIWNNRLNDSAGSFAVISRLRQLSALYAYNNFITDLTPLLNNVGIDSGDKVNVKGNHLNSEPSLCTIVPELELRGVTILYDGECGAPVIITVPDRNLELQIKIALLEFGIPTANKLTDRSMKQVETLDASNANIQDLTSINYCENLVWLNLAGNRLTSLEPLSTLTKLQYLNLGASGTSLTDIAPLEDMNDLRELWLNDNGISKIDALFSMPKMTSLYLTNNAVSVLDKLPGFGAFVTVRTLGIPNPNAVPSTVTVRDKPAGSPGAAIDKPSYKPGTQVYLIANPAAGYQFDHWEGDLSGNLASTSLVLTGNKHITAVFSQVGYTQLEIQTRTDGAGVISPSPSTTRIALGDRVMLCARPSLGVPFREWQVALTTPPFTTVIKTENPLYLPVNSQYIVSAQFAPTEEVFTLTLEKAGTGAVLPLLDSAQTEGVFYYGKDECVVLHPVPEDGIVERVFDHWEGISREDICQNATVTEDEIPTMNPLRLTMNSNKRVRAVFKGLSLHLEKNPISNISPLQNLKQITTLDLGGSKAAITSLLPLAPLKNLTHLALWDLSLDDADLVAGDGSNILSNLKYLTHLDLSSTTKNGDKCNNISSIDWLPNIPHITSLYMQNNKVMSLGALDGLFDLESLYFTGNDIIDLSPLVANLAGVNDGDVLLIDKNPNLSVESVCEYIPTLKDRNVLVTSDLSCDQMGQVYELNIAVRGDGTTSPPPGRLSFREGSRITIEAKEGAGATFVAWEGDTASATIDPADPKKITVAMNGNRDITAVFADPNNKFTLTTYVTGPANSGTVTPAPGTAYEHYENQSVEVTAVPATGFELDPDTGWTIDPPDGVVLTSPLPSKIKIPMTVNREVTVKFREKTKSYTLTILEPTPAGSGLVYPEPSVRAYPYENGQPQTASVRATVERGYEFDYWEGDVAADYRRSPTLNIVMDANKRIRPVFQKDVFDYTLEVNMTGNGRVAASDQWTCIEDNQALPPTPPCYKRYYKGDVVGLTAESSENWVFGFWAGDVPDQLKRNNPISITMDRGRSVTAVFVEAESRTFRTAVTGEGRVDTNPWRDPAIYPVNESVALIATPSAGWEFSAWVIGEGEAAASVGNTNPYFLSLSPDRDNVLATAVFVPLRAAAGITPNTGSILGGETVVITGTGLGSAISVKFGSKTGQLVSVSDTEIKVITPAYIPGVTSVYIDLGVKQIELTDAFRFEIKAQQVLSIMNVTPSSGIVYGGETVYIAGTGFEAPATVKFGETEVPAVDVIGVTETEIRVKSPTHAPGSVAITVTTPKGTVSVANAFTYWTPSLSNAIQCIVADATSGDTIETATVELVPDGRTVSNAKGGIYVIPNVTPGEYTVRVTAPGYPLTEQKVTVGPSEWKNVLVPLVSNADQSSTVECTVKSRLLGDSVSGATVEFFPGKGTFTESADTKGLYVLTGATAGQYTLRVRKDVFDEYIDILIEAGKNYKITAYIGVGLFGLGAQGVEVVDEQTLVKPNLCAAAVTVDSTAKVYDLTVPASLDVSPQEAVASGASLAIRVRSDEPVAPASVKAAVLAADGYHEEGGVWSAVEGSGDTDGWVVFTPESAYPAGAIIYAVANASTVSGVAIEPVLARFQVAASDGGAKSLDALGEISDVVGVVAPLAAPASSVYRLGPDALFAAPQLVQIPLAAGVDPALVGLYYRWTGEDGPAWVDATSVQGWLVPGSVEVVTADGQSWLQFEANYGAVVQAGVTLKINAGAAGTLEISAGGGHGSWLALGAILSLLALALVRIVTTTRSTARGVVRS